MDSVYSKRIKAGKRRTYFFDVKATRGNDFYLTITESRKRFNEETYERHKIFLYKEDFNKFLKGLSEAIDYVKTDLMPDFDFDAFNHDYPEGEFEPYHASVPQPTNGHAGSNGAEMVQASVVNEVNTAVETPEVAEEELPAAGYTANNSLEEVDKW